MAAEEAAVEVGEEGGVVPGCREGREVRAFFGRRSCTGLSTQINKPLTEAEDDGNAPRSTVLTQSSSSSATKPSPVPSEGK